MAHTLSPLINFHEPTPNSNQLIPYFWDQWLHVWANKKPRLLKLLLMILWQIPGKNLFGRVRLILAHSFWENWSIMRGGKMKVKAVKKHMAPHIIENQKADYESQNQKQLQLSVALPQGSISASQGPYLKCAITSQAEPPPGFHVFIQVSFQGTVHVQTKRITIRKVAHLVLSRQVFLLNKLDRTTNTGEVAH